MKKSILALAITATLLASCNAKKSDTHRHPDGREHKNHTDSTTVESDTLKEHGHSHDK